MKKYYLLSLISASLIGATCIQCTSPKQKSGENTLPQKSELFVSLPDYCPTPDGMAIAPNGDLILACPNFADITQPACLMRITKDGAVSKWLDVPVLEETGWASPMGLAFNEEGDLFISDNQGWSGAEKAKNKGRVLRLKFENDQLKETITVASGMEHPNGIRIRNGKLYVTQSSLSQIKDPSGLLVSGVYCFDMNDRDIAVTNTSADQNLLTTVITKNPEVQYGLDGIVFNEAGDLFVGNFGDGAIHRIKMDAEGKVVSNDVWAQDTTQLRTTDGMCIDDKGNIWVADFSANAVARVDKDGKIQRIAQSPDCDGSDGGLDQPGEPIVWNGQVIVSCFDLVTGPDIIFFWVARMIMAGYEYEGKMPFKNVYFTGIVRDKLGRKMSKSLGNSPDPLELIDKYGADGVRMGMMLAAPAGNDILFDDALCEQGRNFCSKIWNAFRLIKGWTVDDNIQAPDAAKLAVHWFESKQNEVAAEVADLFSKYRLSEALMAVYKLFWDEFSSWYLEMIKPAYGQGIDRTTYSATLCFLDNLMHLLHPFMPFITEELWQQMYERNAEEGESLMVSALSMDTYVDTAFVAQFEVVKGVISNIRSIRLQKNIAQKEALDLQVLGENPVAEFNAVIQKMCNLSSITVVESKAEGASSFMVGTTEYAVPLGNMIDVEAEIARMEAELKHKEGFLQGVLKKLSNEKFVNNAPAAVLEMERKKQADAESIISSLKESIAALKKA
mgnify:FL=1